MKRVKETWRLSLQRYEHYFNQFINHRSSLKTAKNKLGRIENSVKVMYGLIKEGTIFDFYIEAAQILHDAKRSLAYSYALGYFLTSKAKISFYEFIQGELESNVIKLDSFTDRNLSEFIDDDSDIVRLSDEFSGFRMRVISLTGIVKKFFDECLMQMENGFPEIKDDVLIEVSDDMLKNLIDINFSDKWICAACTLSNDLTINACTACGTQRQF